MSDPENQALRGRPRTQEPTLKRRRGRPSKVQLRNTSPTRGERSNKSQPRRRLESSPSYSVSPDRSSHSSSSEQQDSEQAVKQLRQAPRIPQHSGSCEEFADCCRCLFIQFFAKLKQGKGLVFTPQERTKMIKEQGKQKDRNKTSLPRVHWRTKSHWQEEDERAKVDSAFAQNQLPLPLANITELKDIFFSTSFMFADQFTAELYLLLMEVLQIAIRGQSWGEMASIRELSERIRSGQSKYIFFSFRFSKYFKLEVGESRAKRAYQDLVAMLVTTLRRKIT